MCNESLQMWDKKYEILYECAAKVCSQSVQVRIQSVQVSGKSVQVWGERVQS